MKNEPVKLREIKNNNLTLSNEDRDLFIKNLENPPKPNNYLQQAFNNYQVMKHQS